MWKSYISIIKGDKPQHDVCQDYCLHKASNGVECITLCDGASSGEHSEIGAEFIANYVTEFFLSNFDLLWNSSYSALNIKLVELHQSAIVDLSDYVVQKGYPPIYQGNLFIKSELYKYGTTIQVCCIKDERMLFYKVGNGSAIIINESQLVLLSGSSHGAETDHFTFASTLDTIMSSVFQKIEINKSLKGVLLFSDGVDFADGFFVDGIITDKTLEFINDFLLLRNNSDEAEYFNEYLEKMSQYPSNYAHDDISMALLLRSDCSDKLQSISTSEVNLCIPSLSITNDTECGMLDIDGITSETKSTSDNDAIIEFVHYLPHLKDYTNAITDSCSALIDANADTKECITEKINQGSRIDKKRFLVLMILGAFSVVLSITIILILLMGTWGNG